MKQKTLKIFFFMLVSCSMLGASYASAANLAGFYVPNDVYFVWKRTYNSGAVWYIQQKTNTASNGIIYVDQEIYNSSGSNKLFNTPSDLILSIDTLTSYEGILDESSQLVAGRQITVYAKPEYDGVTWIDKVSGVIVRIAGRTGEDQYLQELISWNVEDLRALYGDSADGGSSGSDELNGYSLWLTLGISMCLIAVLIKRRK